MNHSKFFTSLCALCLCLPALAQDNADLEARARVIHDNVMPLDTHVDIPLNFASSEHMPGVADAQVNLEQMRAGGLDAVFFVVYVGQTARTPENYLAAKADALSKFDAIHRMVELYPDEIGLATTAAEARTLHEEGKLVALIGVENAYAIGTDLSLLEDFAAMGARYMTLVHNGDNDVGSSAQPNPELGDDAVDDGLTDFGYQVVEELNRLGILVDISHVSRNTMLEATAHSSAPVIASHSGVKALTDHPRNLDDEQLLALAENGGVVQIVAFHPYIREGGDATVEDFVDHIDYAVNLIGIEHVGISSDFGGGGGIHGWDNAQETFNVTRELVKRGYTEQEIAMLWSGNTLRIMEEAGM